MALPPPCTPTATRQNGSCVFRGPSGCYWCCPSSRLPCRRLVLLLLIVVLVVPSLGVVNEP